MQSSAGVVGSIGHGLPRGPVEVYEGELLIRRRRYHVLVHELETHGVNLAPRQRVGTPRVSSTLFRAPRTFRYFFLTLS